MHMIYILFENEFTKRKFQNFIKKIGLKKNNILHIKKKEKINMGN